MNIGNKHLVAFGTNVYPALGTSATLCQCENDVMRLSKTMSDILGFSTEIFIAEQTTKQNIVQTILSRLITLETMADETKKKSLLVIHRSSHGSQQPDQNGDEADKADECWMCQDSKWNAASNTWDSVIIDDELVTILKGVDPAKCQVMVISDTCNSGTFTRALTPQIVGNRKFVFPRNYKVYKLKRLTDKVKNGRKCRAIENQYFVEISEIAWMLFAGANNNSFSYETSEGGILTSTIIEYIRTHRKDIGSVDSAAQWIAKEVRNKNSQQYAHIECPSWYLHKAFLGTEDCKDEIKPRCSNGFMKKLWNAIVFWR